MIIGAPNVANYSGESYVVFGSDAGFDAVLELSSLDGSNGFAINSIGPNLTGQYGRSVSGAGDVNGDGFDDVIIGTSYVGVSAVVFGSDAGFASFELSSLDGSNGSKFDTLTSAFTSQVSVSGAGDY